MNVAELSGLDVLRAIAAGRIPPPSMGTNMGIRLVEAENGRAVFACQADDRHLNPMGGVHGGFAATALDSVTGCAVASALGPGESYGTVHLEVKMLRAVPQNTPLLAEGKLLHLAGRVGFAEATLKDEDGVLYAHGSATCAIKRPGR